MVFFLIELDKDQVIAALRTYQDPHLRTDLFSADCVKFLELSENRVTVEVELGYPAANLIDSLTRQLERLCKEVAGVGEVKVKVSYSVSHVPNYGQHTSIEGVANIVAVSSGKGGVGKSTVAVNLALAMAAEGARVGILDGDIYGPSVGVMLGVADEIQLDIKEEKYFIPVQAYGLQVMSMAFLMTKDTPAVWRGPMASGAFQQLFRQTSWDKLDYLFVDMPPGTGDVQLTLAQSIPVTGSVVVTTPQNLALLDAVKGIEMFRKVDVPILGVVENMSEYICPKCHHGEHIFGVGGGEKIACEYGVPLLGSVPLVSSIQKQMDSGVPTVVAEPESHISDIYRSMARSIGASVFFQGRECSTIPTLSVVDD